MSDKTMSVLISQNFIKSPEFVARAPIMGRAVNEPSLNIQDIGSKIFVGIMDAAQPLRFHRRLCHDE
jgi:hypothetical protein